MSDGYGDGERLDDILNDVDIDSMMEAVAPPIPTEGRVYGLPDEIGVRIYQSGEFPSWSLSLAAGMTLTGAMAAKYVIGPTESSTSLYTAAVAGTGSGKDHPHSFIEPVAGYAGVKVGASFYGSKQGLEAEMIGDGTMQEAIEGRPCWISPIDEYGDMVRQITQAGSNLDGLAIAMKELFSKTRPEQVYRTGQLKRQLAVVVERPQFSLFGATTPSALFGTMREGDILGGFLGRHWIVDSGPEVIIGRPALKLSQALRELKELVEGLMGWLRRDDYLFVGWASPEAERVYVTLKHRMRQGGDAFQIALQRRVAEIAVRIATILAIGDRRTLVEVSDMRLGARLALDGLATMQRGIDTFFSEANHPAKLSTKIFEWMTAPGGRRLKLPYSKISQKWMKQAESSRVLIDALQILVEQEKLVKVQANRSQGGGRSGDVYIVVGM